ncbi:PIN domain-containing protein [Bacteroides sp. GD17]|jgi:predicted nucleic acid-binding protein|uniref:type II toxin-antitoxin system VapC family toxin n=1 Tax=Bacteroides sp. GD17 TaxID=3139826 RepID=UPI00313E74F9
MRRVFLDTNVVLDFLMERENFQDDAEAILALAYNGHFRLFLSSLSFSNIAYIARQLYKGNQLYDLLDKVRELVSVSEVDDWVVDLALKLRAKDFEDALQYYSALKANADVIVTRNLKDFSFSDIKVVSPKEFLKLQEL